MKENRTIRFDESYCSLTSTEPTGEADNGNQYVIRCDGNQWSNARAKVNEMGLEITITGDCEYRDFLICVARVAARHGFCSIKKDVWEDETKDESILRLEELEITFGKFKGKRLGQIDLNYLEWLSKTDNKTWAPLAKTLVEAAKTK